MPEISAARPDDDQREVTAARPGAGRSGPARRPRAPQRPLVRWPDWTLAAVPAVTLAVMLWGISARPYWGDEADTVSAVSRSLPELARLLGRIDAVHGLYYLLLWPLARVAGTGETMTRLPSAAAMAAAALGVTLIGRKLRSRRAGLCAGLVFAALPMVTLQGHDARPYGLVTAAAVLASLQLIRVADDPRPWRFAGYGASVLLLGYLELLALPLVAAHAVTLAALRRSRNRPAGTPGGPCRAWPGGLARRWLVTMAAVTVGMAPVTVWGWLQRGQISWIREPGWGDAGSLAGELAAGPGVSAAVILLLAILGARHGDAPAGTGLGRRASGPGRQLTWLAVPWLGLPPLTLLAASAAMPVYNFRYVTFCLPAVALLAGAGLAASGWALRAPAAALIVALALPSQLSMRVPGSGMRAAAQLLAARGRPGDAVIYPGGAIPPWYLAYPRGFGQLRNIGLARAGAAAGRLYGTPVPRRILLQRERGVRRIWVVEVGQGWWNPGPYLTPGFWLVRAWWPGHGPARVGLYQRSGGVPRVVAAGPARAELARAGPAGLASRRPR